MNAIAKLDKKSRDALPDDMFAVPRLRKLLLNDERHTLMAWKDLDNTQGLTPAEREAARERILARAAELGVTINDDRHRIETGRWLSIDAMALNIATDDDHPNKMPFSGVLTKLDEPSDFAPGGAAVGKVPHIWRDHDYPTYASAETNEEIDMTKDEVSKLIASAVETAVKPFAEQLKAAEDKLAATETKLADVKASARKESEPPARKAVNPMVSKLLAGTTIAMPEGDEKLAVATVDTALKAAGLDVAKRLMVKNELTRIGAL